jgi:hypothetical protein
MIIGFLRKKKVTRIVERDFRRRTSPLCSAPRISKEMHQQSASFDTRHGFAAALLRMRNVV